MPPPRDLAEMVRLRRCSAQMETRVSISPDHAYVWLHAYTASRSNRSRDRRWPPSARRRRGGRAGTGDRTAAPRERLRWHRHRYARVPDGDVGSRDSDDLHRDCGQRAGFAALLGGVQLAPSRHVAQPYLGGQVGFYHYEGTVTASHGLMAAPQVGLRVRLGSLGGAYVDASYLMVREGGFPIAGMGLYLSIPGRTKER
jgi:hypothetical protein